MTESQDKIMTLPQKDNKLFRFFVVCVAGILLNMLGSWIVYIFKLPIYLDTSRSDSCVCYKWLSSGNSSRSIYGKWCWYRLLFIMHL
jgi:hypothetical protein